MLVANHVISKYEVEVLPQRPMLQVVLPLMGPDNFEGSELEVLAQRSEFEVHLWVWKVGWCPDGRGLNSAWNKDIRLCFVGGGVLGF